MVHVLIDRKLRDGGAPAYEHIQREMRFEALRDPSYVTGETWRDVDDPLHYVVLSTWRSRAAWDAWSTSPARRNVLERMKPLVLGEHVRVFEIA